MELEQRRMTIVATVSHGDDEDRQTWWRHIGFAIENDDESWDLHFDLFPVCPQTDITLRSPDGN